MRTKFKKGEQRKFLDRVLLNLECPSLRNLLERGINIKYSCLKNYYLEYRTMPQGLVNDLCFIAKINSHSLKFLELKDNWGQVKGGKKGKRKSKI